MRLNPPKSGNLINSVIISLCVFYYLTIVFVEFGHLDTRVNYPFISLSIDNVFEVMGAILTEQRILFICSSYTVLAYNIEVCYVCVVVGGIVLCVVTGTISLLMYFPVV